MQLAVAIGVRLRARSCEAVHRLLHFMAPYSGQG